MLAGNQPEPGKTTPSWELNRPAGTMTRARTKEIKSAKEEREIANLQGRRTRRGENWKVESRISKQTKSTQAQDCRLNKELQSLNGRALLF